MKEKIKNKINQTKKDPCRCVMLFLENQTTLQTTCKQKHA